MLPALVLILLSPFGGPGGEEPFGWRGYAQPRLQEKWGRWGPLITSLIIGTIWAVWHLPEFFNPKSTQYALGIWGLVPLIIMEIANSIIMTWLYIKTGGSVLVAGVLFHLMLDISGSTMLVDFTVTGMRAGEVIPPADTNLIIIQTAVMMAAALLLIAATRGRLGLGAEEYSNREEQRNSPNI
jgi:membrane protease YdiL (CAAX protease family)